VKKPPYEFKTKKELIGYIWEYYKLWIIGAAIVLIAAISLISSIASKPKYDYDIAVSTSETLSTEETQAIADAFAALGRDVDGNGAISVNVTDYRIGGDTGDDTYGYADQVKFTGDAELCTSAIYIMDEDTKAQVTDMGMFGGEPFAWRSGNTTYYVNIRAKSGKFETDKKKSAEYNAALELFNALKASCG